MNQISRSRRLRQLAVTLALFITHSAQITFIVGSSHSAAAQAGQKQFPSGANERGAEMDDEGHTRARRAGTPTEPSSRGPIIRVALMTDVSSISLSSSTGLIVRPATGLDEPKAVSNLTITVEMRSVSEPANVSEPDRVQTRAATTYRLWVGSSTESRRARKLVDELKKKFFEPVEMIFDEKKEDYSVLIGMFPNRSDAARFLERLRKSGYESLRIVSDLQTKTGVQKSETSTDENARAAKYKAQPTTTSRSSVRPYRRLTQLIALAAERVAATSEDELVVSPVVGPQPLDRNGQATGFPGSDRNKTKGNGGDQNGGIERSRPGAAAAVVRVGKIDYRGEIKLILNPRGRINVVNALPLEDYLRGVVPMELSPGAYPEIEALKAQAVAARSYALARLGRHLDEGYDLVDDTRAQVYGGLSAERELTNRAIDETRGTAAVFPNEEGKLVPIEALYTANCGGHTENNDEAFGGRPVPYLRAVACSPDRKSFANRDIISTRPRELLIGTGGRSIAREVGLLSVLGFSLPLRVTGSYLSRSAEPDEIRSWLEQTARLFRTEKPRFPTSDGIPLAKFAHLVAVSVYGEGRATTLLSPADVEYLLGGLRVRTLAREERAAMAMLLRDGVLRVPADSVLDSNTPITRGQSIETLARALSVHQPTIPKSQPSNSNFQISQISNSRFQIPGFISEFAVPAENGRLMIATPVSTGSSTTPEKSLRLTNANTSGTARLTPTQQGESPKESPVDAAKAGGAPVSVPRKALQRDSQRRSVEVSDGVWLFRNLGGESHQVDRLTIIGGERISYHLNAKGQVDFLEASITDRTASSDRFSSVALWQERITVNELRQRLARARINVGRPEKIEPVAFSTSSRVTEVEITGDESRARLRRSQIRAALGLKEYLFVVDRETDVRGEVVAFVFTGRGWGHGVGMCQTGAYGLALEGYSHNAILQRYYTGVILRRIY